MKQKNLNSYTLARKQTHTQSLNKWKSYDVISNLFQLYNRLCCCHCYLYIMHTRSALNILTHSHHQHIRTHTHTHIGGMVFSSLETYVVMVRSSYTNYNLISSIYIVISNVQGEWCRNSFWQWHAANTSTSIWIKTVRFNVRLRSHTIGNVAAFFIKHST